MRAVAIAGPGEAELTTRPAPVPADGETLVLVAYAAICGTDRRLVARGEPGRVPGHELAGWAPDGTPVGLHPDLACGTCAACGAGFGNRCSRKVALGIDRDGGLAETVSVPSRHAVALGDVPVQLGALLEPLACVVHAVRLLAPERGTPALVVGAGAMGILAMWALQAGGARVVVSQRSPARRKLAAELGADAVVGPGDDPHSALGAAPRLAIVTAPGAEALTWALEQVAPGGRVHTFAGSPGGAPIDANLVHYRHLHVIGSTGSDIRDYRAARDAVMAGAVPLDRLPRDQVPLEAAATALTSDPDPATLRTVVAITGAPP